jgi:hypothetical protein
MNRRTMLAPVALPVVPMDVIPFGEAMLERARAEAVDRISPILYLFVQHEDEDGPYVDRLNVWNNEDGLRCGVCPKCNFRPGPEGIGCCVVRRHGEIGDKDVPNF